MHMLSFFNLLQIIFLNYFFSRDPSTNLTTIIPMTPTRKYAVDITNNGLIQTENLSSLQFWDQLYDKYDIL